MRRPGIPVWAGPSPGLRPPPSGPSAEIFDGASGLTGANPHFYFLPPFINNKLKPNQLGIFDSTQEPEVVICPLSSWDGDSERCLPKNLEAEPPLAGPLAEYSFVTDDDFGDRVMLDEQKEKYWVVWKSQNYYMEPGETHRIAVYISGLALGWADVAVYDPDVHNDGPGSTINGVLILGDTENQNISFRIEEGALEAELCPDEEGLVDCDVLFVDPQNGGILTVFKNPEAGSSATPGAKVEVPVGGMGPNGPLTEPYPLVLQLQQPGDPQGGAIPSNRQLPPFVDFWSPENGIYFPRGENNELPGAEIILCQPLEDEEGGISNALHYFLVIFLVHHGSDGPSTTLLSTTVGDPFCEGYEPHDEFAHHAGDRTLLERMAVGFSRAARFFLPDPLFARRRLHGGLNTVVWEISGDDGGGAPPPPTEDLDGAGLSRISGPSLDVTSQADQPPELLELGAILNVDPDSTGAHVSYPQTSYVGSQDTVRIPVLDAAGEPFLFAVDVVVTVSGATTASDTAKYNAVSGSYEFVYSPGAPGSNTIDITLEKAPFLPQSSIGPYTSTILPAPPSADSTTFSVSGFLTGSPTTVTVTVVDEKGLAYLEGKDYPIDVEVTVAESGSGTVVQTLQAQDDDGQGNFDGTYQVSYTPTVAGSFDFSVTVQGEATADSPQTFTIERGGGDLVVKVEISGPASEFVYNLPVEVYYPSGTDTLRMETDSDGIAVFPDLPFGNQYVVHLPKRDFDVQFTTPVTTEALSPTTDTIRFNGTSQALPASVQVWRVGDSGNGNAYEYTVGGRSWTAANNQVRDYLLLDVEGHLVDILSPEENIFVRGLFFDPNDPDTPLCPGDPEQNEKQCKLKGWIGLTDEITDDIYLWVTGEPFDFSSWGTKDEELPNDPKGNQDYVEINASGIWNITNGASTTNEGYFTEWDVTWPDPPVF